MSINYAILGILSATPLTGYDLKKIMQDSPFMYWSGNNNQIYKALLELHDQGYVTHEVRHQDGAPSKKVYTITEAGLAELRRCSLDTPELPEFKKPFLVQLAWAWQLDQDELAKLLDQYEAEVRGQLLLERGRMQGKHFAPARTPRERALWPLLYQNIADTYQQELGWIAQVRSALYACAGTGPHGRTSNEPKEELPMQYTIAEKDGQSYLRINPAGRHIQREQDGLDLIALCAQHGTNLLLIPGEALSEDFFRLRTGLAGAIAQKFTQYAIRAAIVLDRTHIQGKFNDFAIESNRGRTLYVCADAAEAEHWLLNA